MSRKRDTLKLKLFGNTLGLKLNAAYALHHALCSISSKGKNDTIEASHQEKANELRARGFTLIENISLDSLAQKVTGHFNARKCENGVCAMNRAESGFLAPDLFNALESVNPILYAYYGSYYQYYWSEVRRNEAGGTWGADSSFGFHTDDNPKELLKVFFYLNDTFESNGAFRTFDYQTSRYLFNRGFISYSPKTREESQKLVTKTLIDSKLNILEGPKGTALIFDNNLVHRASPPQIGFRDIIAVEVYPSPRKMTVPLLEKSLTVPYKTDYPHNPFKNDILAAPKLLLEASQ